MRLREVHVEGLVDVVEAVPDKLVRAAEVSRCLADRYTATAVIGSLPSAPVMSSSRLLL